MDRLASPPTGKGIAVIDGVAFALISAMFIGAAAEGSWSEAAEQFVLGPVAPSLDLRNMLTQYLVRRSCALFDDVARRRREALAAGAFQAWRDALRKEILMEFGAMPFGDAGGTLNIRPVSRHERTGFVIENVLFESLPGLDVNGSLFLPDAAVFPPPWPGIVIPVGHSTKTGESYQLPAQAFARMGYAAITFDPPGMAGEKQPGNDHFADGVRCYLTGHSSNRYFIIDALRCIDYLATRPDIDLRNGVGMTGVSGGGVTTMFAAVLDDRIKVAGPSCCAVSKALHPILDNYAECPEVLPIGRLAHYDDVDLLVAAMPATVLLMAGAGDEVFTESMSRRIAEEVASAFEQAGFPDRFSFFLDPGGHAYTLAMAVEFAKRMDAVVRGTPGRALPEIAENDLEMLPADFLMCRPRLDRNIYSINCDMAAALRSARSGLPIGEAVRCVANATSPIPAPEARSGEPALVWAHYLQEWLFRPEPGIELPATYLYPSKPGWRGAALLYFDDRGRWTDLRTQGLLAQITRALDRDTEGPAILTVDVRGWGDTQAAAVRYDIAGWGGRERWIAYVSAGISDGVLAMRIRDGLAALAWLRDRPEIDPKRIIVGGRGMGGVVALQIAAADAAVCGVFSVDALAAFEFLASSESYAWPPEAFLPGVLQHYDLPELAAALAMPTLIVNPLDAAKKSLTKEQAETCYVAAMKHGGAFRFCPGANDTAIREFVQGIANR